ncbi:MAG: TIR domain-containing protein [Chthoniobacterales bacterium]|nr:TIR domain-containing protein [Chthoniobacterales bacterium]
MREPFQFDVFLSHNAKDKTRVRRLGERLKQAGLRVWLDEWNVRSGDIIALKVDEGLEQSRVLVLCISSNALASRWVDLERSTAIHRDPANGDRRFIPLLLDDCDLPDSLRRYKYVDYRNESAAAFSELVSTITDNSAESPGPAVLQSAAPSMPTPKAPAVRKPSNSKQIARAARPTPWEKMAPFAVLSFASFLCGVGLLILMLWNAERLVSLGLAGNLYYIVLLPLGLAVAGFLFGVFRSYARYTGKQFGGNLELGGPIVGFAMIVIGGFYLPKPAPESFDVTVLVHGQKGSHDLVLRNSGMVWMTLGSDRRYEKVGDKGQADFKNVPARFRGQGVPISVEAMDWNL